MKLRLSNEVDWAAEFAAQAAAELEAGCRWVWRKYVAEFGINKTSALSLHYWDGVEWMSSGQYTLDKKIKSPPTPHTIGRVAALNEWIRMFSVLELCHKHAEQATGLLNTFVVTDEALAKYKEKRKAKFSIVRARK